MAKNWSAYEAAREVLGNNKENIAEIGSRFPLFARTVAVCNNEYLLDILKALPKTTARVVETGLKEMEADEEETEAVEDAVEEKAETNEDDYSSMTAANLYKLCCKRGISSKCKSRKKDALIELLEAYDNGELEEEAPKKATKAKAKQEKKSEPVEDDDNWEDEDENEDPYAGKNAKELFTMCKERGIKVKPKQKADAYVKLLKADDEKTEEPEDDEDEDDEWEI